MEQEHAFVNPFRCCCRQEDFENHVGSLIRAVIGMSGLESSWRAYTYLDQILNTGEMLETIEAYIVYLKVRIEMITSEESNTAITDLQTSFFAAMLKSVLATGETITAHTCAMRLGQMA